MVWQIQHNSERFGKIRIEADHCVFYRHSSQGCIYLIVYVHDNVIAGSDQHVILQLKRHLSNEFHTKDLGKLCYFLGIEVARPIQGWYWNFTMEIHCEYS